MATRAEQFRADEQRATHHKPKRPKRGPKRRDTNDVGARNLSKHGERKATVVTEESLSGKPSRKSSRAGAHHSKNSVQLDRVSRLRAQQAKSRHDRRHS